MEIDFTQLQKRGLLKAPPQPEKKFNFSGDVLDLSAPQPTANVSNVPSPQSTNSAFDFLESFASAAATTPSPSFPTQAPIADDKITALQTSIDRLATTLDNLFYRVGEIEQNIRKLTRE